jgi:dTDP-4-dehydrorhamnose reductase
VFLLLAGGYRAALPGIFTRYHVLYYFLGKEKHFLRIAIVGAQGMLGSDLIAHIPSGHQVIGTDIDDFDITNQEETLQALLQIKPAWVINVAAYTQVDRCEEDSEQAFQVNAAGVKNLALACKEIRAKLFHVSTDYVFDGKTKKPYREEDALNPLSVYGQSKCEGESAVRKILNDFIIIRTGGLYGKGGNNFVNTIIKIAQERDELTVVNDQWVSPTYTVDLSKAIGTLVKLSPNGIFHVVNSGYCSWYQFACIIVEHIGSTSRVIPISSEHYNRVGRSIR